MGDTSYCLLTACKNEVEFIAETIRSVVGQTLRPRIWLILDDGSTDGTAELVHERIRSHGWIRLHRLEVRSERNFGSQYRAIMRGYQMIQEVPSIFIGVLDADISFESPDYYRRLMVEFNRRPRLGIAGGIICEWDNGAFKQSRANAAWFVHGAVQTFRRKVFDSIGGYTPLEYGGSDGLAVLMANMKGWEVRSMPDLRVLHHRPSSTADGLLRGGFRCGLMDAAFGYHPLFMLLKCVRRLTFKPRVLGSFLSLAGYLTYRLRGGRPVIPAEALQYLRWTQRARIAQALRFERFDRN